jgi:hypothetical protein
MLRHIAYEYSNPVLPPFQYNCQVPQVSPLENNCHITSNWDSGKFTSRLWTESCEYSNLIHSLLNYNCHVLQVVLLRDICCFPSNWSSGKFTSRPWTPSYTDSWGLGDLEYMTALLDISIFLNKVFILNNNLHHIFLTAPSNLKCTLVHLRTTLNFACIHDAISCH